ncbi:MAG: HigA family addiction module antitoxin [Halieaceae bacterium]|jgi:addiction module HigA family antidote|nr:HigA family addiction module antitoxin [Halieaceae bacterium]
MVRIKTHPGAIIREDYLKPLGLQQSELASVLEVDKATLSRLVNERSDLTPELAIKISKVLGGTPESWMNLQTNFSLSKANELADWRPSKVFKNNILRANTDRVA